MRIALLALLAVALLLAVPTDSQVSAQKKSAAEEELNWRLFEVAGRSWSIKETDKKTENSVINTHEVVKANKDRAIYEWTEKSFEEGGRDLSWMQDLLFNTHEDNVAYISAPKRTKKQDEGELVEVKAGKFWCDIYKKGAGKRAEKWWMCSALPGLIVKSETKKRSTELIRFTRVEGDPDLEKPQLTPEQKKQRDWALFLTKGQEWTIKTTRLVADKTITSYASYEVTKVKEDSAEYRYSAMDGRRQKGCR